MSCCNTSTPTCMHVETPDQLGRWMLNNLNIMNCSLTERQGQGSGNEGTQPCRRLCPAKSGKYGTCCANDLLRAMCISSKAPSSFERHTLGLAIAACGTYLHHSTGNDPECSFVPFFDEYKARVPIMNDWLMHAFHECFWHNQPTNSADRASRRNTIIWTFCRSHDLLMD